MAKSKNLKIHYHEETRQPLVFSLEAYNAVVKKLSKEKGLSQKGIMREIAKEIWPDEDPEVKADTTRKWKNGANGPRELSDIRKMEKLLGCSLTIPYTSIFDPNQEGKVNNMNNCSTSPTKIEHEERLAAQEAYCALSDLIAAHKKMMLNYANSTAITTSHNCSSECIPEDFPSFTDIHCKLRKLRFNLPYCVYRDSLTLAEAIYGVNTSLDPIISDNCFDMTEEHELFDEYAQKNMIDVSDSLSLWGSWIEYATEQADEYYEALEDIFDAYLN